MKKILLIFCIFLLVGCEKQFPIEQENVQAITYDNVSLLKKEHETILDYFNQLKWKEGTLDEEIINTLTITTKDMFYTIQITDNNHVIYKENKKSYYSKDHSLADFIDYLNKRKNIYLNDTFYDINLVEEYQNGNNDFLIKLEQGNYYYILESEETITDFRIHELEVKDKIFEDVNVLFQKELIEKGHRIIIRINNPSQSHIRITFTTPYGYQVSIVPVYNEEQGSIIYQRKMIPKENS